jgi:diadenosine tetraphosphate (Ap4A) HIT family hydrolase
MVMHLPEEVHMSGRNMEGVYRVHNIPPYTYVHLLVLISRTQIIRLENVNCLELSQKHNG